MEAALTIAIQDQVYVVTTEHELLQLLPRLAIYAFSSEQDQFKPDPVVKQVRREHRLEALR